MRKTEHIVTGEDRAHLTELFVTLRRLPPRMGCFWDVAYGRAQLVMLGEDSIKSTWFEERALRLMLALAMATPEPLLREQFDRVIGPDGSVADVVTLVRPLVHARMLELPGAPTARTVWAAVLSLAEVVSGHSSSPVPAPGTRSRSGRRSGKPSSKRRSS